MKKEIMVYMACAMMGALSVACSSQAGKGSENKTTAQADSVQANAPQAMQSSLVHEDITFEGKSYHTTVLRRPDKTLPVVANEQGEQFFDNRIKLRVECENRILVDFDFTKEDFSAWVDKRFLHYAILEAIVFNEVTPSGLAFSASVCYPQTDLYMPLRITVKANGTMVIEREDLEETPAFGTDSLS